MYQHEYDAIKQLIEKATKNALSYFGLDWDFKITHPWSEFQINFYKDGHYQCDVNFDLPPNPDEGSITQLIIGLLHLKLDGNDNN